MAGKYENREKSRTTNNNTHKKCMWFLVLIVLAIIVCAIVLLSIRELSLIDDAKEIVDRIVKYSIEKAEAEMELESGTGLVNYYQEQLEFAGEVLDSLYITLDNICAELSEIGKAKVQDYINEVFPKAADIYNELH